MKFSFYLSSVVFLFAIVPVSGFAADSLKAHTDFLYREGKNFIQDVYVVAPQSVSATITLTCYYYTGDKDSILIFKLRKKRQQISDGITKIQLDYPGKASGQFLLPSFSDAFRHADIAPAGLYKLFLSVQGEQTMLKGLFIRQQDSTLSPHASLHKGIEQKFLPPNGRHSATAASVSSVKTETLFLRSEYKIKRYLKKRGLRSVWHRVGDQEVIDIYDGEWFIGRYAAKRNVSHAAALQEEQNKLKNNIGAFTHNDLVHYPSLMSQFRELRKESRENDEITGNIALSASFSNEQETFSGLDDRYYELTGAIEFPVFDIPFSLSGYYTTQDRRRQAKASYLHFHYDAEKAKEQLIRLISAYNKRYSQTIAKRGNYEMIYGRFIQKLKAEKAQTVALLKQETGMPVLDPDHFDSSLLKEKAADLLYQEESKRERHLFSDKKQAQELTDKMAKTKAAQEQEASDHYNKINKAYRQLAILNEKIGWYETLLNQYKNTTYFDSVIAFQEIKDLENLDRMSYKDLSKRASGILPEKNTKQLMAGLTKFEAGIFSNFVSDYTISGQRMKGIDAGYDIGFSTIGVSYGKTEYIDRKGDVEDYKAYSGRMQFKPLFHQRFGVVYYGYSPGNKLLTGNNFFKNSDISLPGFRNPVHIISATYKGRLSKHIDIGGEYALSQKQGQAQEAKDKESIGDQSAYNVNITGNIPATPVYLEAGYEFAGNAFENNTLPMLMTGTERLRVAGKGSLFRSVLTIGIEYNYLLQSNFSSQGKNVRWGFEIGTHSKRYPSVYLSYKPFSSFRRYDDTLGIEQRPVLGAVWTGKAHYQIKKQNRAIRFSLIYNKNTSAVDTVAYGSNLLQFNTTYSHKATMLMLSLGMTQVQADHMEMAYADANNGYFTNMVFGGNLTGSINLNGGVNIATCVFGLSRYGLSTGGGYNFKNTPVMVRVNFRYNNFRLDKGEAWQPLYAGSLELDWYFKMRSFKNNSI